MIKRTPICFTDPEENKKFNKKLTINDPRSPTNEYNRTPIHMNSGNLNNQNDLNNSSSDNHLNESTCSQESSLLLVTDLSMNMQNGKTYLIHFQKKN